MFTSTLYPGEFIIDDDNYQSFAPDQPVVAGEEFGRGYVPRNWDAEPFGSLPYAAPFGGLIIPRNEWPDRIAEMNANDGDLLLSRRILDTYKTSNPMYSKNQQKTNFCWFFGVVGCMETNGLGTGVPYVPLSPAFGACQITNFQNKGGWGGNALDFVIKYGVCTDKLWPQAAIDRRYLTQAAKQDALTRRVTEWEELDRRNFGQLMTALLLGWPVACGYNWWRHLIYAVDPMVLGNNEFGIRGRNSWGDGYGQKGFFVLAESKATQDDAVMPRVQIPSMHGVEPSRSTAL